MPSNSFRVRVLAAVIGLMTIGATTVFSQTAGDDKADDAGGAGKPAAPAKTPVWTRGQKIEVKDSAFWKAAAVVNRRGDWYLIEYEGWNGWREWVEPWRIRKIGSKEDIEGWHSNGRVRNNEGPPRDKPGQAPVKGERKDPFASKPYDKPITKANLDKVNNLTSIGGADKLAFFDGLPANLKLADRGYVLKGKTEGANLSGVLMAGTRTVIVYTKGMGSDTSTLKIERLNLATGENEGTADFDALSNPVALSPTGNRVLGRAHGFHTGTRSRVDLFDTSTKEPKHLVSFIPYPGDNNRGNEDVQWAAFVGDDDHVLTCNGSGSLVMWDSAKATALWRLVLLNGTYPAISPGGKQMAIVTGDGIAVVDALSGKTLCNVPGSRTVRSLTFTPDGKRLVGTTGTIVSTWDLDKGALIGDIGLPVKGASGSLAAAGGNTVLVGGSDLLDLDKKVVVWRYTGAGNQGVTSHGGKCWAVVRDGDRNILTGAVLPHPTAQKTVAAMAAPNLLVKPGDTVSLEVAFEGTDEQRKKIADQITVQLKRNGISVADNRPVKLIARTEQGKTDTRTYQRTTFGVGGPPSRETETVSVTEKITRIYFEFNGVVAWENRTSSTAPWSVQAQQGQTIGQAVQAASQFNLTFLESVRVPMYVPVPTDQPWLGTSRWSMGGVKDDR
jgi:WD40 repeat protein